MSNELIKAGERTGEFGLWLTEILQDSNQYQVYYDHGDSEVHDNVAVIKAFLGETVTRENKLADVDVMVANRDNEILLLIEIEESPLSPKTLLGDIFASLFSTNFAVRVDGKQTNFSVTDRTRLLVTGYVPRKTNLLIEIRTRLKQFSGPKDSITIDQVVFVIEDDLDTCLVSLQKKVIEYLALE